MSTPAERIVTCRVRYANNTYVATTQGKRATCTTSAQAAAEALGRKVMPGRFARAEQSNGELYLLAGQLEEAPTAEAPPVQTMPTKEQWDKIQLELSFAYGSVEMEVDGIQVTWQVQKAKGLKYSITPFIDGKFSFAYFMPAKLKEEPSDEVKRNQQLFCQIKKRTFYNEKEMKAWKKAFPKSEHKKMDERNQCVWYNPLWGSPRSLVAHLKKAAQTITIKRIGYAAG